MKVFSRSSNYSSLEKAEKLEIKKVESDAEEDSQYLVRPDEKKKSKTLFKIVKDCIYFNKLIAAQMKK